MKQENISEAVEKQFLTPDEACRLLGCSRRSLEYWKRSQGLPFVKLGSFVRIDRAALLDWFKQFTIKRNGGKDDV